MTLKGIREFRRGLEDRRFDSRQGKTRLAAIINCAFPENVHLEASVYIMESFAGMAGFSWAWALCLAQGEAIGGKPLERAAEVHRACRPPQEAYDFWSRSGKINRKF